MRDWTMKIEFENMNFNFLFIFQALYKTPTSARPESLDWMSLPSMTPRPGTGRTDTFTDTMSTRVPSATPSAAPSLAPSMAPSAKTIDLGTLALQSSLKAGDISPTKVCMRAQSAVDRHIEDLVSPISRHCCDVLGPRVCHQCSQLKRQDRDLHRNEARYPSLHITDDNYATTVVVQKYMPFMSPYQVQHKVASGEIKKPDFKEMSQRVKTSSDRRVLQKKDSPKSKLLRAINKSRGEGNVYFHGLRDLNQQIISGKVGKNISKILHPTKSDDDQGNNTPVMGFADVVTKKMASFTEQMYPMFVSPRKMKEPERPSYIAYYEPPLLPKVCQNVEPQFFAGADSTYKLPDRLPDNVVPEEPPEAKDAWA